MRHFYMGFQHSLAQVRNHSKTVTRRLGWKFLTLADMLYACEKSMGLRKGEKKIIYETLQPICLRWEPLNRMIVNPEYGRQECIKEGFPHLSPKEFVDMVLKMHRAEKLTPESLIHRIEYKFIYESAPEQLDWIRVIEGGQVVAELHPSDDGLSGRMHLLMHEF